MAILTRSRCLISRRILTHIRCHMDDARIAVETGVDGVDVVIGTSSFLREFSHGKDMAYIEKTAIEGELNLSLISLLVFPHR